MKRQRQFAPTHTNLRRVRTIVIVVIVVGIFSVSVIRAELRRGMSAVGVGIVRGTHSVGSVFGTIGTAFRYKRTLESENATLKTQVSELTTRLVDSDQVVRENADLKSAMGRNENIHFTIAAVIAKPPHSIYDTMLIDGGKSAGMTVGQTVYANGETPIGTIDQVLSGSALVRLYSAPGEATEARLSPSNIDISIVGRGGGNFSATIPHDTVVADGAAVVTKETNPSVIAVYRKVTSDSRDPFQTLLLVAPVNINELAYVEVRK